MRFGKRLAEIVQSGRSHEPYISYKELKHTIKKVSMLIDTGSCSGDSSGDDCGSAGEEHCGRDAASADGTLGNASSCTAVQERTTLESHQKEFFRIIDINMIQAKTYIESSVHVLEAVAGEWQMAAVMAGLIFTPHQLEDISAELPFRVPSDQAMVDWLLQMRSQECTADARVSLTRNYNLVASSLNNLQQYIEVNVTALRKIFKKFEKKVPVKHRIQNVREHYKHHDLLVPSFQQLFVTALQMQHVMFELSTSQELENLVMLAHGIGSLDEVMNGGSPARRIDVYAKPNPDMARSSAGALPLPCQSAAAAGGQSSSSAPLTVPTALVQPGRGETPSSSSMAGVQPMTEAGRATGVPAAQRQQHGRGGGWEQEAKANGEGRSRRRRGGRGGRGGRQGSEQSGEIAAANATGPFAYANAQDGGAHLHLAATVAGPCRGAPSTAVAGVGGGCAGVPMGSGCGVNWLAMMPIMWPVV